jgi:hypothetical protein
MPNISCALKLTHGKFHLPQCNLFSCVQRKYAQGTTLSCVIRFFFLVCYGKIDFSGSAGWSAAAQHICAGCLFLLYVRGFYSFPTYIVVFFYRTRKITSNLSQNCNRSFLGSNRRSCPWFISCVRVLACPSTLQYCPYIEVEGASTDLVESVWSW